WVNSEPELHVGEGNWNQRRRYWRVFQRGHRFHRPELLRRPLEPRTGCRRRDAQLRGRFRLSVTRTAIHQPGSPRGPRRLPGLWNVDASTSKTFRLAEAARLQIRGDMFNILNHTNFNGVTSDVNSSNFGRFTSTAGARVIQLNLRLSF